MSTEKDWRAGAGIPRRACLDLYTPAELAIAAAIAEVERVGADVLLTEAVILLGRARDKVADHVDRKQAHDASIDKLADVTKANARSFAWSAPRADLKTWKRCDGDSCLYCDSVTAYIAQRGLTDHQLAEMFAEHCECRPINLARTDDEHSHDCDLALVHDLQAAMFGNDERRLPALSRCSTLYYSGRAAPR